MLSAWRHSVPDVAFVRLDATRVPKVAILIQSRSAFAQADHLLDKAVEGPFLLKDPRIASLVVADLEQGEMERPLCERYSWVITPNHVHIVIRSFQRIPVSPAHLFSEGLFQNPANVPGRFIRSLH